MTIVAGTIQNVWGHTTVLGPAHNSSGSEVLGCFISAIFSGTYASENATILAVPTAIQNSRRDGKTVTLVDACAASPTSKGVVMGAQAVAKSTADLTMELTKTDLVTEHDGATVINSTDAIAFFVTYILS